MQLDPSKYGGMVSGFSKVIAEEGAGALLTGLGPTAVGYFIQGWFKFGGVEYFKINAAQSMTEREAWNNRNTIYLGSAAVAEFIAEAKTSVWCELRANSSCTNSRMPDMQPMS